MRTSIAIWLLAAAASAKVTLGPPKWFAAPPAGAYSVVALVPRESGVSAFYLGGGDNTLYEQRLGESTARAVLTSVEAVRISNGIVAFQRAGTIFTAPLLPDDSVDLGAARVLANGSLVAFGCSDARCLAQWKDGAAYRAQIVGGASVPLEGASSVLAVDPGGFLLNVAGKLRRVTNDGAVKPIATPALLGNVTAADFDGTRYTVVGQADPVIAAAAVDVDGTVSRLTMVVDQRNTPTPRPYRSNGAQIAWNGTNHLVVAYWSDDFVVSNSFAWPIWADGYLFTRDLQSAGRAFLGGTSASPAAIAFAQNRFWVLWYDLPLVTWNLYGGYIAYITVASLSTDGTKTSMNVLGPPYNSESLLAVAASDAHIVGVWSEQVRITGRYRIRAQAGGDASSSIIVGDSAVLSAWVANAGDAFLVAMQRDAAIEGVLRANNAWTRLDLSSLGKGGSVAVAANDAAFLVATADRGQLVAVQVTDRVSARIDLGPAANATSIAAASDGSGFALLSTRDGSTVVTVIDSAGNVIASREIGPAATSLVICWSGTDYVAIGMLGTIARTWRLARYGDALLAFDTERKEAPISIARAGEGVVATWYSSRGGSFLTTLPPGPGPWDAPVSITRSAVASRGNDALLFFWTQLTFQQVLATSTLHYDTARPRTRAVR